MQNADGTVCDKCKVDCGNGTLYQCMVVSRLNVEDGIVENFHFCEDVRDDEGKVTRKGCAPTIMKAALRPSQRKDTTKKSDKKKG